MVANSVQQYIRAGVAGFHIEDQVLQKRCGHLQGKEVVSADVYLSRIRAAISARDRMQSDIVIIARTDALQPLGYDECISRLKAARAEGADVGLLEGFTTKAEARQAVKDLAPWPLMINMVENAVTPLITVPEAQEMGFRIMNFSFACLSATYTGIRSMLTQLRDTGVTGLCQSSSEKPQQTNEICMIRACKRPKWELAKKRKFQDEGYGGELEDYIVWIKRRNQDLSQEQCSEPISPKLLFEVCGMKESMSIDAQAGGAAFAKGV
jgi:2-methylisocitrate lyase-like PEP mutase family enzyme